MNIGLNFNKIMLCHCRRVPNFALFAEQKCTGTGRVGNLNCNDRFKKAPFFGNRVILLFLSTDRCWQNEPFLLYSISGLLKPCSFVFYLIHCKLVMTKWTVSFVQNIGIYVEADEQNYIAEHPFTSIWLSPFFFPPWGLNLNIEIQ